MTKYVARLNGQIVGKRTSKDRTYTHAIVVQRDQEEARIEAADYVATAADRDTYDYYAEIVRQGVDHEYVKPTAWRAEPDTKLLCRALNTTEGGFEAYAARKKASVWAQYEDSVIKGAFEPHVAGWVGRPDLVAGAVKQFTKYGRRLVAVVDAEVVVSKADQRVADIKSGKITEGPALLTALLNGRK